MRAFTTQVALSEVVHKYVSPVLLIEAGNLICISSQRAVVADPGVD